MPKTISLPDTLYQEIVSVSEELSDMAMKQISLSMTVYIMMEIYHAHISDACARDFFRQKLASSNIMSPEEFEKAWDLTTKSHSN